MQNLDPRVKILTFSLMAFIIIITPQSCYLRFAVYGIFLMVLLFLTRPKIKSILLRFFLLLPLLMFLGLAVILFGEEEISGKISILWNLTVKSVLVFLCFAVFQLSTPVFRFLKALELLPLPKVFPALLRFAVRYISFFFDEITRKKRAWISRCFARWNRKSAVRFIRFAMPGVFLRAVERSDRIYAAMLSRGYNGRMSTMGLLQIGKNDWLFLFVSLVVFVLAWMLL
ncbi:MAG: energy-coupling factor transporter transmembrane protein EcfT [Candidatus Aminicenantes bacterium]|nr:energy-coupling factor transporter transmembrane protein EcfT [Candidatus Aminicenantes bacterium]